MKDVPFYANRDDDTGCTLAVYRSILKYFTGKEFSWPELEQLSGFQPNKAAWTVAIWTALARRGFDIKMVERFDYTQYAKQGRRYLDQFFSPQEADWNLAHSNLAEIQPLVPEFLKTVNHEKRSPTLGDIAGMLAEDRLVAVAVNSRALNCRKGYVSHMILVHGKVGDDFLAHDPGLPPQPNRIIEPERLLAAMGGSHNTAEVTGIKLDVEHG